MRINKKENIKKGIFKRFIFNWLLNLQKAYSTKEQIINIFIFLTALGTIITLFIFEILTSNKNASSFPKAMTIKFSTTELSFLLASWTFLSILICALFLKWLIRKKRFKNNDK